MDGSVRELIEGRSPA